MGLVRFLGMVLAVVCAAFPSSAQGLYVETHESGSTGIEKFWYMPKMFRSEVPGGRVTIIRVDSSRIYTIDPGKRAYTSATFDEIKEVVDHAQERMKKKLQGLSSERRAQMEEQLSLLTGAAGRGKVDVQRSDVTRVIAGLECRKFTVRKNGVVSETIWATTQVTGSDAVRKDLEGLADRLAGVLGVQRITDGWLKGVDGFPVQTEHAGIIRTVTRVDHGPISVRQFEVPGGYHRERVREYSDPGG